MEKKYTIGIDPGLSGALSFFLTSGMMLLGVKDMPVMSSITGKGRVVDVLELAIIMEPFRGWVSHCVIERVGSMPTDGVASAFKFGKNAMAPEALAQAYRMPVVFPTPGMWKKKAGLLKKDKGASLTMAKSLFPEKADLFKLKKHEGRAEAVLIAMFGRPIEEE